MRTILLFCYVSFSVGYFLAYAKPGQPSGVFPSLGFILVAVVATPAVLGYDVADFIKPQKR